MNEISATGVRGARRLRGQILLLGAVFVLGSALELASLRHWDGTQIIPWIVLAILVVGYCLAVRRIAPWAIKWISGSTVAASAFGVWQHVESNHATAVLDARYEFTWGTFSSAKQWWLSASGGVGSSPPLVPLVTVLCGALLWIGNGVQNDAESPRDAHS
jgi:hypothetical protein